MALNAVEQALARKSFAFFCRLVFRELNPGSDFAHNWHLDAITHALDRVHRGHLKRLIITLPPRSLKSLIASVAFPAFVLGHDPTNRLIAASYSQDLATKFHNEFRQIIGSEWYRSIFANARIGPWKDTGQEIILAGNGSRYASSVGGTLTGRGANILIIDDPLKAQDAHSETKRGACNDWLTGTAMSRLDDKMNGVVILVMQRLHVDDPVGHMLERAPEDWLVLNLPAIAPRDMQIATGWKTCHRFIQGTALHPEREITQILARVRRDMGSEVFDAQYLQEPVPPGGSLIQRAWLGTYDMLPDLSGGHILQSWDTASKTAVENDWSVCTTWLVKSGHYYLLDVFRAKLEYPALRAKAVSLAKTYAPWRVLVEDAGIGTGLLADLRREGIDAIACLATTSKADRMRIHSAKFESGRVLLPLKAPWRSELIAELLAFPHGRFDDQVGLDFASAQ